MPVKPRISLLLTTLVFLLSFPFAWLSYKLTRKEFKESLKKQSIEDNTLLLGQVLKEAYGRILEVSFL